MRKPLVWSAAVAALTLSALAVAPAQANAMQDAQSPAAVQTATTPQTRPDPVRDLLGPELRDKAVALNNRLGIEPLPGVQDALLQVIDPNDYKCDKNPALTNWLLHSIDGLNWSDEDRDLAVVASILNLAGYATMFEDRNGTSFGLNGEFTIPITHTFKDLRSFWDIRSDDMLLRPWHSATLANYDLVYKVFRIAFGDSEADSVYWAHRFSDWAAARADVRNHPILSLNGFAYSAKYDSLTGLPNQIVMGDGLLQAMRDLGLGDIAPQTVLAHEYGHEVQFADDLFLSPLPAPEASRRLELMADGFAGYFITHSRGASMQEKRLQEATTMMYDLGDCGFSQAGHHGTPNQRFAAVTWGADLVASAPNQGHILPSLTVGHLFEAALPKLTAPDAN
jgi:hypothetical protein